MDKIRIGVIGVAKVNQQKDEIRVMLKTMDEKLKKENNVEAFVCTEPLFNEALIQDTAKKMELDERVDVLVVIVGTWVFSSHVISAVNDLSIPFVLFGESEEIMNIIKPIRIFHLMLKGMLLLQRSSWQRMETDLFFESRRRVEKNPR